MAPTLYAAACSSDDDDDEGELPGPDYAQVQRFHELGGEPIFGTDVDYMTDCDTTDESKGLALSGLDGEDMLRKPTAVAGRFGVAGKPGLWRW